MYGQFNHGKLQNIIFALSIQVHVQVISDHNLKLHTELRKATVLPFIVPFSLDSGYHEHRIS